MIPAQIASDYALWTASITAARPLRKSAPLVKAALVTAGVKLVGDIDAALDAAVGALDDPDPTGFAGTYAAALQGLATAATDQLDLSALRGIAGRMLFNLQQV